MHQQISGFIRYNYNYKSFLLGLDCTTDFDGCGSAPCNASRTNCTDLTPAEEVAKSATFECGPCPVGLVKVQGECEGKLSLMLNYQYLPPVQNYFETCWHKKIIIVGNKRQNLLGTTDCQFELKMQVI